MSESPRRSSRPSSMPQLNYSVGDIVEIKRSIVVSQGRLVSNLTNANTFDSDGTLGEKMHESSFGQVMQRPKTTRSILKSSNSFSEDDTGTAKRVTFSQEFLPRVSSDSSTSDTKPSTIKTQRKKRASTARQQRSSRLQAKKHPLKTTDNTDTTAKRTKTCADTNEEVVKVPMRTGILYLYRGSNPRAEFVRRA